MIRLARRLATVLVVVLVLVSIAGCSKRRMATPDLNAVGVWMGIAEPPPLRPVGIEIICDPTDGSQCMPPLLRDQLHAALATAATRPGSFVRAWVLGDDITTLQFVGMQTSPGIASNRSERAAAIARDRFVATGDLYFAKACEPIFERPPLRRSLIAESISRVAWADAPSVQRVFIVLTDGREYSRFARMDCGPIPDPDLFVRALNRERVLVAGSLGGVFVSFAGMDVTAVHGQPCAETIAKADQIRTLWRQVLLRAGAPTVTFNTGITNPDQLLAPKEAH